MAEMTSSVVDNTAHERFELVENGHLAYASYRRVQDVLHIPHVETDMSLRGSGAAGRLMVGIVAYARAHGLRIVPICSYAVAWFRRNPDVGDVLK